MDGFSLTRAEVGHLLMAMESGGQEQPADIMQKAWSARSQTRRLSDHPVLSEPLPAIAMKLMKSGTPKGLSLHEIAELGQLVEFASPSATSMQNWVKRDFKSIFVCPQAGKKYAPGQAALLYMIDDLKSSLDFESIRNLFAILFGKPDCREGSSAKPFIEPVALYKSYAALYEEMKVLGRSGVRIGSQLEEHVRMRADKAANLLALGTEPEREALRNFLLVAVISVQSAYCQALARRYSEATLFLGGH
ncbi:DUF1836 domain-containing protein [Paenibacillus sp. PAMC21692]|uniref:DUF1836 domain-containing protein n=1 Tax=Paenibacillus sp. PAMC21692 TaxID=2762320 RepID=UPI00164E0126|nr:DUF1836 domain-containing protein [Paenibacillus sp. PAMC21692]QNK54464.1 DUF1836 domain-containing protein [Paenibacillus sp. PAMC21692]